MPDRLTLAKRHTWNRLIEAQANRGLVCSMVECRICGQRHALVIPAESPHVRIEVHDTECLACGYMTCDTI
jgi:hypothetical protein